MSQSVSREPIHGRHRFSLISSDSSNREGVFTTPICRDSLEIPGGYVDIHIRESSRCGDECRYRVIENIENVIQRHGNAIRARISVGCKVEGIGKSTNDADRSVFPLPASTGPYSTRLRRNCGETSHT
jgi:hypothetical protein